ncbi:hypothetical protein [Streptomyces sp. NPDC014793]|uniref:hypothetical protein n=1 Tax=Streptomyces sp. NPDC014793 TaxID=3364914 RepID=UPI00370249B6
MAVFHEQARVEALSTGIEHASLPPRGGAASLDAFGAAMLPCVIGSTRRQRVLRDF